MKTKMIKLKEIVIKPELYPRQSYDWKTALSYSDAMKVGNKFPNVCVALLDKRYVLVDGKHRLEAYKTVKQEYITVDILEGLSEREIFIEAIKRNTTHGKPFNAYDKRNLILRLEELNMPITKISELVRIPMTNIKRFVGDSMTHRITGERVILKSAFRDLVGKQVSEDFLMEQDSSSVGVSFLKVLNSFDIALRNKAFNLKDDYTLKKMMDIKKLLDKILVGIKYEKNRS